MMSRNGSQVLYSEPDVKASVEDCWTEDGLASWKRKQERENKVNAFQRTRSAWRALNPE